MSDSPFGAHEARELAAELALGIAPGIERARALQHLESCRSCRTEVGALGEVADGLLLLIPAREPPPGFESRVLAEMQSQAPSTWAPRAPARRRRLVALVAAAVVATSLAAATTWWATRDERHAGELYLRALHRAGGQYLGAEVLRGEDGARAGHVFVYAGDTSWIFVMVDEPSGARRFEVEITTREGERLTVGALDLDQAPGVGLVLPIGLRHVAEVILEPTEGGAPLVAELPDPSGGD